MELSNEFNCPKYNGDKFAEGSDFVNIRPLHKKMSIGSNKTYTFRLDCGKVISIRIESPEKFRK